MTTRKQDKNFVTIKNYNKEKEALLQKALEKSERGEQLSESEAKAIKEHFPTNEFVQKMTGLSKAIEGIQTSLFDIVESSKPFVEQVTTQASSLSERLRPVLEELDLQYKENPLTREEIEEGSKFFDKYIKEKEKLVKELEDLTTEQETLYSKIFEKTGANEEDIVKYKLESEDLDFPSNLFIDISRKLEGEETTRITQRDFIFKQLRTTLPKNIYNIIAKIEGNETQEEIDSLLTQKEWEKVEKAIQQIKEDSIFFENRPSRIEIEHIDTERELKKRKPLKYILYQSTDIHFENISQEDFKTYLQEESEIIKKALEIQKIIASNNNEILTIFSRASNPYFEGKKEEELSEEDKKIKADFYDLSFLLFQNSTGIEQLVINIFLKNQKYKEIDLERQERFFEFLKYTLEDLEELKKKWNPQEEIVEQYLSTNSKNKLLTTEKIVPQIMLSGEKIEKLFKDKEAGKIEKVTFDLSSGDLNKNFIIHFLMTEYKIPFEDDTFRTLESLMTIQYQMEKQFGRLKKIFFDTKYVIYLNKGGRVTNYSKALIRKTNREIISLMSAVGSLDTTDFFFKYFGLDEETIVEENEAIFEDIRNEKEWNKKIEEIRKSKIEKLPKDKQFPFEKIKKISMLQPFVSLKGLNIKTNEETDNNTLWTFNDVDEKPIPLFEVLKITGRFASLPLEMDSYLTDSTINNEVTRNLKTIIANLNYYKTNTQMKKDKTKKNFLEYYFEGTKEGETESKIFEPFEAMQLLKEKKLIGQWRYKVTRTIDSIAKDCKFDEERGIGVTKEWKHNKEKLRFIDSIVDYLRKAKEDKNIVDFVLYTTIKDKKNKEDKIVKDEDYITENEKRSQKTKNKIRGKETKTKQTKNPTIEKIAIIIK